MQSVSIHVFFNATGSVRPFPCFFWGGGEYVCLSYGPLKIEKSAKSKRKSVRPFIKKTSESVFTKKF